MPDILNTSQSASHCVFLESQYAYESISDTTNSFILNFQSKLALAGTTILVELHSLEFRSPQLAVAPPPAPAANPASASALDAPRAPRATMASGASGAGSTQLSRLE